MKRFHVHVSVQDLSKSVNFYSTLFGVEPTVRKADYAKWQLDDPRVNFAISTYGKQAGLDHLGIQAESDAELEEIGTRLAQADVALLPQKGASCCYAKSDKYWTLDPQGIAWESFHSLGTVPVYGADSRHTQKQVERSGACCAPGRG
jgi:catechol-2,3-dioxygenase